MAANHTKLVFRQFEHAVDGLLEFILARNPRTIVDFLMPYDAYTGRVF